MTAMGMGVLCLYVDLMTFFYAEQLVRDDARLQQVVDDMLAVLQARQATST